MKITTWNARGLNAPSKKRLLKRNLTLFDSDIILLQETKLNQEEGLKMKQKLGKWTSLFQQSQGASGGLGIIWNPRLINMEVLSLQVNWMGMRVTSTKTNLQLVLINIYGPTSIEDKLSVWNEISSLLNSKPQEIAILGGDFNAVTSLEEKSGGINQISKVMEGFKNWINKDALLDIKTINGIYTWNNRRKGEC